MRWFLNTVLIAAMACLSGHAIAKEKNGSKAGGNGEPPRLDIPIPPGHEAKELKLPYYDVEGKLQMLFHIEVAERVDKEHVKMARAKIETFDTAGGPEPTVDLPTSVLDLKTSIVSSNGPVTIRRSDFELTGEGMTFNTQTRQGTLTGNIRMLLYDRNEAPKDSGS